MPRAFETKIHLPYQHWAFFTAICRSALAERTGQQSVQRQSSDLAYELRDEYQAEANVVVPVVGVVPIAIRGAAVLRVVVPAATAQHPVRTHDCCPF